MSTRHARIEIVPTQAKCEPHRGDEPCPVMEATEEQCWRYLPPSYLRHHLRLVAANGRILASSEEYDSRAGAVRALQSWYSAFLDALGFDRAGRWTYLGDGPGYIVLDVDGNPIP